jgi:hypothetical protein
MLFLDPLDYHSRAEVVSNVRNWLNAEWNRKHKTSLNMFNNLTMESFSPKGMFFVCFAMTAFLFMFLLLTHAMTFYLFLLRSTEAMQCR